MSMCGGCSVPYWTTRAWRGCGLYVLWCGQLAYGAERWICATSRCVVVGHACRCVCAHAAALIAAIDGCAGTDLRAGGWCLTCMVCVRTTSGAVCDGEQVLPRAPVVSAARVPMRCELCRYENDVTRPSARHVYTSPYRPKKYSPRIHQSESIYLYISLFALQRGLWRAAPRTAHEPMEGSIHTPGFPNRGGKIYKVPGDLSRRPAESAESKLYARTHAALLQQDRVERAQFVHVRSHPEYMAHAHPSASGPSHRLYDADIPVEASSPGRATPLVNRISVSHQSRIGQTTARVNGTGTDPQASANGACAAPDAMLASCEVALTDASKSVQAASTAKPATRKQALEAAAAMVADAKEAHSRLRGEIKDSLTAMQKQMEDDMQRQLVSLTMGLSEQAQQPDRA